MRRILAGSLVCLATLTPPPYLLAHDTLLQGVGAVSLVINEIDVDQIGADQEEFVEILNTGADVVDFSQTPHVLVFFNGSDATLPVIDGSYRVVQLAGMLQPGTFLVIGGPGTPNVDIVIDGGGSNLIQNGTDAVALYAGTIEEWDAQRPPTTVALVDAVVYDTDDDDDLVLQASLGAGEQYDEWNGQGSIGVVFSIARSPDGGPFQTGATPTPGESNDAMAPLFAIAGVTLLHQNEPGPVEVLLRGEGGIGSLRFRIQSLPAQGTLFDGLNVVTGTGSTSLPYLLTGTLTYTPIVDYTGLDSFQFDAVDALNRISDPVIHELAVQSGGLVITEVMHSPGTFQAPQDQRVFEFIEVFNRTSKDIAVTRLDGSIERNVDTTDNLFTGGEPAVIPAWSMRIVAPGGLTADSDDAFACEWGLAEEHILRIPHQKYETLFSASRLVLFGTGEVLLDAVSFWPPDFWTPIPGASQSVRESFLVFCEPVLDSAGNDCPVVWPYSGPENRLGLRTSYSGVGLGSPGFVPDGLNEDFVPLPECQLPALGGCCLLDGRCATLSLPDCQQRSGTYVGDYVPCDDAPPCSQPQTGACCMPTGDCDEMDEDTCASAAGQYEGADTMCDAVTCDVQVTVVINEIEYSQAGDDTAEYIELYGQSGLDLTGYSLVLYNGDPQQLRPYREIAINGVIPDDGFYVIGAATVGNVDQIAFTSEGIQNGSPDGMALVNLSGLVVEAIAYGGSFISAEGPAAGVLFEDIGVQDVAPEAGDPAGEITLQRIPNGMGPWTVTTDGGLGPDGTPGTLNTNPLPAPYGACCLSDASCLGALEQPRCAAAGGTYRGDATTCGDPCPVTTGACCLPNGECVEVTSEACGISEGTFHGAQSECASIPPCPQPPVGACCLVGGDCVIEDAYDCGRISGDYRGDNTTCGQPGGEECGETIEFKINEIYRDNTGIDNLEFIELYGPGGMILADFVVIEIEGDFGVSGQQGRIDKLWSLGGLIMPGDGFFVLGDDAVVNVDLSIGATDRLENGTATYLLIEGFDSDIYPRGTDIDVDNDGIVDAGVDLGIIIDGVAIVDGGIDEPEPEVDRIYFGVVAFGPAGSVSPAGLARRLDGLDTERPSDFCELGRAGDGSDGWVIPTPGGSNNCSTCILLGDATDDGLIDLRDFGRLQLCFTGMVAPSVPPAYPPTCRCLDFDLDGDIDLVDYAGFHDISSNFPALADGR